MDTSSELPSGQPTQESYSPCSSPQKGSSRNQKYFIRTRRASCMDPTNTSDGDPASSKRKFRDASPTTTKQLTPSPPSSPAHTDSEPEERKADMPKRGKGRGKSRGRGVGRGILKKTQFSSEASTRMKQAESAVAAAAGKGRGRGGRGRASSTQAQSPMTRAAAAGLQAVQFLSLPRKRTKKRQGEDEGTEEDDYDDEEEEEEEEEDDSPVKPQSKKPKLEEHSEDPVQETTKTSKPADAASSSKGKLSKQKSKEQDSSYMDSTLEEEKDTSELEQDDKVLKSPSKPVSRRGGRRGRRGGGRGPMAGASKGSRLDTTLLEKSGEKDDVMEIAEPKKSSPMQPPTRGKRRGRPPKKKPETDVAKSKTKEDSEDTAPVADKALRDSQEEENSEEMDEDQSKEGIETAESSAAATSKGPDNGENESTNNDTVSVKVEKEDQAAAATPASSVGVKTVSAGDNPVKQSSVIVSVLSGSKPPTTETSSTSKQSHLPTHPSGEGHFPYHSFPMEDMHSMPPPHPFIHSGYPPFSAPPYGSFLVPSSPSYPYPPPEHYHMYAGYQEDMSYHGFPHPRAHLPPPPHSSTTPSSTTTPSSSTTLSTATTSNTTSTPTQVSHS